MYIIIITIGVVVNARVYKVAAAAKKPARVRFAAAARGRGSVCCASTRTFYCILYSCTLFIL